MSWSECSVLTARSNRPAAQREWPVFAHWPASESLIGAAGPVCRRDGALSAAPARNW
jgi:hypothetical protein